MCRFLDTQHFSTPSQQDRRSLLKPLLTPPCLLDICSLYGTYPDADAPLAPSLIHSIIALKPTLSNDIATMAGHIAQNFIEIVDVCISTCAMLTTQPSMLNSIADGATYLRDGCIALCALLRLYTPASLLIVAEGPSMIEGLVAIHDALVPKIQHALVSVVLSSEEERILGKKVEQRCNHCELVSEKTLEVLIYNAYIQPTTSTSVDNTAAHHQQHSSGGSGSSGSGSGGSGSGSGSGSSGSGSSSASNNNNTTTTTTAVHRGESLLNALTLLGHRESSIPQQNLPTSGLSMGAALSHRHGIAGAIHKAIQQGIISIDDVQSEYIAALLDVPSLGDAPAIVPGIHSNNTNTTTSTSVVISIDDDDVVIDEQLIGQVRDVLPEYGDGFIACCLDIFNNNVENTINALLEGSLPGELGKKDSKLSLDDYIKEKKELNKELESQREFPSLPGTNTHHAMHAVPPNGSSTVHQNKPTTNSLTARYLDLKDTSYKSKVQALEAQWEYEDEYDDSYDDLLHVVGADGAIADAEGDDDGDGDGGGGDSSNKEMMMHGGVKGITRGMNQLRVADNNRNKTNNNTTQQQQQQYSNNNKRQQRGKGSKLWVLDQRIYNYAKEGAIEVGSEAEAHQKIREAKQASLEIHGLGPGGNIPLHSNSVQQSNSNNMNSNMRGRGRGGGGSGRGRGRSGGNRGGRGDHHHNRKDKAAQKASRGMQ